MRRRNRLFEHFIMPPLGIPCQSTRRPLSLSLIWISMVVPGSSPSSRNGSPAFRWRILPGGSISWELSCLLDHKPHPACRD